MSVLALIFLLKYTDTALDPLTLNLIPNFFVSFEIIITHSVTRVALFYVFKHVLYCDINFSTENSNESLVTTERDVHV